MYECDACSECFYVQDDVHDHMDDYAHWECETCSRTFGSQHSRNQHMNAIDHWAKRYGCETCAKQFRSERAAEQHMEANGHYENYCKDSLELKDPPRFTDALPILQRQLY
ncbi:hypothetical protein F66182_14853 [Fusarium sp. NRRL 66182]|nr:hypothetical protein F66182_14853 [Fusarium sp. NRRL 66182]